eukprot:CAMPEP_0201574998 /NCGR_PEP_ID=MMETSP0190_2-20130828/19872_1 /ASSEMBLY_ACC=CAM_ASM_000263 /TAXON_ID=37353 /ORGANISM="Rosalina sp." /LENGTH=900 /DNA_ID=CAMNT_0048004043 /DNA_START=34 /DNA_END=2736 /DNA_ORIENTATION=-
MATEKILLRQTLEKAAYDFVSNEDNNVKTDDDLPSASNLRRAIVKNGDYVRYIEARKFILAKIDVGQWTLESIKSAGGKIVKNENPPAPEEKEAEPEPAKEKQTGNLLEQAVKEATEETVKEAQQKAEAERKKKEEATPSQEDKVGPVTVKDTAFDNIEITEEEVNKKKKEKEEAVAAKEEVTYVTRKEIRKMSDEEVDRFFNAVDKMMVAKDGAGTSEFFRLASYHGYPRPIYCQHGRETFPGWHRIYLQQFELALQAADKENGNDGKIGLPYWDWTTNPEDGLPSVIRKRFGKWPDDLFPKDITDNPPLTRDTDKNIGTKLVSWGTINAAYDCLLATEHYAHASTGDEGQYASVERSHNHLHVIVGGNGGTMASVAWAAYDIAFWLHHNQVDRVYESYLKLEPDSSEEFETYQEQAGRGGGSDLYDMAFTPFKKPNGEYYYPRDTFDTKALGYVFEDLMEPQPLKLTAPPTLALFRQVKVYEFESKCYQVHVYVVGKKQEEEFKEPQKSGDIDVTSDNYAGGDAIFGRGMECSNCMTRPPVDLIVNISKSLIKLQLSRYDVVLKVYIEETTDSSDALLKLSDTPLPEPIITGPFFESREEKLDNGQDGVGEMGGGNNPNEVKSLQRYLAKFGYYDSAEIDGIYGPKTTQAVMDLQKGYRFEDDKDNEANLKVDGYVGAKTKRIISDLRRCANVDPFANNEVADEDTGEAWKKSSLSYYIDVPPGYLERERVEEVIESTFKQWSDATDGNITFKLLNDVPLKNKKRADVVLSWTESQSDDPTLGFDGAGGVLGAGGRLDKGKGKGFVNFDISERWVYGDDKKEDNGFDNTISDLNNPSTWYRGKPKISLLYVALHEIGHVLGLDHSARLEDVMGPYYIPEQTKLQKNDIQRVKSLYPKK